MFQRELARSSRIPGTETSCVALGGRGQGLLKLWPALKTAKALVVSLPVVAWKRVIIAPFVALGLARLRGVKTVVVLHEWRDLNPLRRAVMVLYLACAQSILTSSPSIEREFSKSSIARFAAKRRRLIPIPPNLARPPVLHRTALADRLIDDKSDGKLVLGHFGGIYPKKQSDFVLDVAAALRKRGRDARVIFIGSFIKGHDGMESRFWERARALGLQDDITVTGYIRTAAEIFALFEAVDVFVYGFREGLTSRRGSVLACIQSGRPVVVNEPVSRAEFDHHPAFRKAMQLGLLHLLPKDAGAQSYADSINAIDLGAQVPPPDMFDQAWRDAARVLGNALDLRPLSSHGALSGRAAVNLEI
jgi:glycosyltransferase involved in cell wall biosynthesis